MSCELKKSVGFVLSGLLLALSGATPALAQSSSSAPKILDVFVDLDAREIEIVGANFDQGNFLSVGLGDLGSLPILQQPNCTFITSARSFCTGLIVEIPLDDFGDPVEGDFLLMLGTGRGQVYGQARPATS